MKKYAKVFTVIVSIMAIMIPIGVYATDGLVVDVGKSGQELASELVGSGITVSDEIFSGNHQANATFSGGENIIGFDSGIILSTGNAESVVGPNSDVDTTTEWDSGGDSDLDALSDDSTYDAAVLEFDFIPNQEKINFQYVLTSEEYEEWISVSDIFAIFVNGVNVAFVPDTNTPVSIGTINHKNNQSYYRSNTDGSINTEMDGLTVVLTAVASVNSGQENHIKFAIADYSDWSYDSNIFIKTGSLQAGETPNSAPTISDIANQTVNEGESISALNITIGDAETAANDLLVTATSDNQTLIPNSNISLGGSGVDRTLTVAPASGKSGTATITVTVQDGNGTESTAIFTVNVIKNEYSVTYNANGSTGGSVPVDGNTYSTSSTAIVLGNTGTLFSTGNAFAGWNTQADGEGTSYSAGAEIAIGEENITLYAEWTEDSTPPSEPVVSLSESGWTNENITVAVTSGTDAGSGVRNTQYRVDDGDWLVYSEAFEYSSEGEPAIQAKSVDYAGNETAGTAVILHIDKANPIMDVTENPIEWTSGSAILSWEASDNKSYGWTELPDGTTTSACSGNFKVDTNGDYIFTANDLAGNSVSVEVGVKRIDNTDPTKPSISVNPADWTTGSALVSITPGTDSGSGVLKTEYKLGSEIWTLYEGAFSVSMEGALSIQARTLDNVGNIAEGDSSETRIDRIAPEIALSEYEIDWTNQNITVSASDSANDGFSNVSFNAESHEFTTNGSFTFTATDEAGNTDSETVIINNIDKTDPVIGVTGNPIEWTSGSAILSWIASDGQSYKWTSLPDGTTSSAITGTCTALENGDYAFTAIDQAGNTASQTVEVRKIDKSDPIVSIASYETDWTNENITVSASDSANDGLSNVSFNETSHEFTTNGSFIFTATDGVGNTDSETVSITNIDKTNPVIIITGDNPYKIDLDETYNDPGATASDDASGIDGEISPASTVNTSRLGTYSVKYTVRDKAGNEAEAVRTVEVVDSIAVSWINLESVGTRAASVKASIDSLGASGDIVSYGLVWSSEKTQPTIEDSHNALTELSEPGEFICTARNLSSNTDYHIRAYAEDSTGVKYSRAHTFKTDKKPVTSVTVPANPETTEPQTNEDGREVYDFTKATSVPEVTGTLDGEWIAEQSKVTGEEGDGDEPETLLDFGTASHSIRLPVNELLPYSGEEADSEDGDEENPAELESCQVTVREEKPVKANWLISDVPDEQKEDREVVSQVVTYEIAATMSDGSVESIDTFDSYVERRLTVESNSELDVSNLVAVRFDDATGEFVPVPASFEENEDGTVVAIVSDNQTGSYAVLENNRDYGAELPETHWAAETAANMSKKLMLEEVFDEGMDLDVGITRAEMSGVLLKALGINKNSVESDSEFEDLPEGSRWHKTVLAATEAGILKGYGDGNVRPEQVISREEMAAVIFRTMDRMIEMAEARDEVIYEDHGAIKAWAIGQVNALTDIEVFKGYESGEFMPGSDIKVGEALTALYRMSRYLNFID